MATEGTVREWSADEGFGVIDSTETPGGCWAHFSVIVMDGYRSLQAGQRVSFTFEPASQDGFSYVAITVWPPGVKPETPRPPLAGHGPSAAYRSSLTIRWSNGTVTKNDPEPERRRTWMKERPTTDLTGYARDDLG